MDFPWCPNGEVVKLLVATYPSLYALLCFSLSYSVFHSILKIQTEESLIFK